MVIEEGEGDTHRAVAVDGPVTLIEDPAAQLLDVWEARHGSRADWAAAWFELIPRRLVSYIARNAG